MSSRTQTRYNPDISATSTHEDGANSATLTFAVDGVHLHVTRAFATFDKADHWRKSIMGLLKDCTVTIEYSTQEHRTRLIATLSQEFNAFRFEPIADGSESFFVVAPPDMPFDVLKWFRERINARIVEMQAET